MGNFKKESIRVLVATDIAARGIDVDDVSHVFNYDLPDVPETFVHRIGRTARAGKDGIAISFCAPDEEQDLRAIEKLTRIRIPEGDKAIYEKPYLFLTLIFRIPLLADLEQINGPCTIESRGPKSYICRRQVRKTSMNESIHVTVSGSPWGLYGAFVLGALVTFCAIWGYTYLKSRGQKKDELEVLLGDIWEKFLDADHYAAEILHARMVLDNAEYYVNEFAKKLGCIEFIIESKSGLLGGTIYATL